MAISTIKLDSDGKPLRAKYRIVALGNLDPYQWSKSDCYAPVLSLTEMRLLLAISVKDNVIPKQGDVAQAFCNKCLPPDEQYILRPPHGDTKASGEYWLLKKTLYGLKRSPKHWFDLMTSYLLNCGLTPSKQAPCIYHGHPLPGRPKLYLGLYVDDFIYFSTDPKVEAAFESKLEQQTSLSFLGSLSHFLGIKFTWSQERNHTTVHLSQEAFADHLIAMAGLDTLSSSPNKTPYRSGLPVDIIDPAPQESRQSIDFISLQQEYRSLVGSLLWLSQATRPDLAAITSILAKHQTHPTHTHIKAAQYAIKYLISNKSFGITFTNKPQPELESFIQFPIQQHSLTGFSDANWGPQDQTAPNPKAKPIQVPVFAPRSISGFLILLYGPIHWSSRRQTITARSSAESEIYATDECVKFLQYITNILKDLEIDNLTSTTIPIYNDNRACVDWSKTKTTKGLRHITIRENSVRELVQKKFATIKHISGNINPSDIFTKEDKDKYHFILLRNLLVSPPNTPTSIQQLSISSSSQHDLNTHGG